MATPLQELVGAVAENTAATEAHTAAVNRHTDAELALHRDVVALMGEMRGQASARIASDAARAEAWATLVRWLDRVGDRLGTSKIMIPLSILGGAVGTAIVEAAIRHFGVL